MTKVKMTKHDILQVGDVSVIYSMINLMNELTFLNVTYPTTILFFRPTGRYQEEGKEKETNPRWAPGGRRFGHFGYFRQ